MFLLKSKGALVWSIVTVVVIAIVIVLNVLLLGVFAELFSTLGIGKPVPKYAEGIVSMYPAQMSQSKEEALELANAKNVELAEEGFVLLKNEGNALPLPENARVSVFGKNSVNLAYGGSGSGGFVDVEYKTIYDSLEAAGIAANPELRTFYQDDARSGPDRSENSDDLDTGGNVPITVGETPVANYSSVSSSYASDYRDAAIIVITRIGGEGFDLPRYQGESEGAVSADSHYLELDRNEIDMIDMVCSEGFDRVIVVFNIPSAMEASFVEENDDIDAAIMMGFPGGEGVMALGSILNGDVTPSGHLVDTWSANFKKDPTFVNFGTGPTPDYTDRMNFASDDEAEYYFVDYEEGIYVGYRYYETRYATYDGPVAALESEGNEDFDTADEWYAANVVYPFGYGLSYTTFSYEIVDKPDSAVTLAKGEPVPVTVNVTNTGETYSGKAVVQLYCELPYVEGEIEKAAKVLVGFAKTELLGPGDDTEVTIEFDPYDAASYDVNGNNGNGCFVLEAGDYALCVSTDVHTVVDTVECTAASDIVFDEAAEEGAAVENRYTGREGVTDSGAHLQTRLSRNDWSGTWPAAPTGEDLSGSAELLAEIRDVTPNNPNDYSAEEYPYFEEDVVYTLRDLLPESTPDISPEPIVSLDDERWEDVLNACSPDDLIGLYNYGAYHTRGILNIGLPETLEGDGPGGFTCFMNRDDFRGTCNYVSEPVMAATWNLELMREMGNMLGEEGAWGSPDTGMPYSGIYAPGVNIHRSFFGGRCSEYFSEDPFMSGSMAAAEILGAQETGVACYVKHFAVNEQETHRSINGDMSWVDEGPLREIYLRPFEMAVKDGQTRAIMSSFNRIGTKWTGGDYRLLTEILREEWGFKGTVICDFNTVPEYANSRQMAYAGGDLNLATTPVSWCDASNTSDAVVLRQCTKNIMYTIINSNAMNGEIIGYGLSTLAIIVIVVDCVIGAGLVVWGVFAVRGALRKSKSSGGEQA